MVLHQSILELPPFSKGFHLITGYITDQLPSLPKSGFLHLFIQHTSAGLCINENADPDVLHDFNLYFDRLAPQKMTGMKHMSEGADDMPAHVQSVISGASLMIPIGNQKLLLGTWQGIYLCEFREGKRRRSIVLTISS